MYLRFYLVAAVVLLFTFLPIRFFIRFYRRRRRIMKYVQHLPTPDEYPFVGSGLRFFGKSTEEIMKEAVAFMANTKTPFYAWFAGALVIVIDHPDDAHVVLTSKSCLEKAEIYKFFNMGTSLFTAPAHIWKPQRKILNTAFNLKILQSFVPIFNEKVQFLIRNLNEMVGKDYFDITPMMHACTLDMICGTTLGADIDAQNGKNSDYVEALGKSLAVVAKRTVNLFYHFDFIYKRTALYEQDRKYLEESELLPQKIIDEQKLAYFRENSMEKANEISEDDDDRQYETPQIFLRQLFHLYSKGMIDDKAIRDQVYLMIFAGNDTSALTLSYAILLLAMHPDVQDRAAAEVDQIFANLPPDAATSYDHVTKMEYIDQIIRETLRLNPAAPYLLRLCKSETKISACTIPRDTTVIINLYTMQRRADIWGPKSNDFDPSRFDPDQVKHRNPNAYAPFSLGPRNCIGMRYAYLAMKITLANILRHYHFSTHLKMSDVSMRFEITLKNVVGNMVRVEERRRRQKNG